MNKNSIYFIAFVLLSTIASIRSQSSTEKISSVPNQCVSKTKCGPCIQTPNCAWCMQPDFGERPRCFQPELTPTNPCPEEFVIDPSNEMIMIKEAALSRGGQLLSGGGMTSGGTYEEQSSGQRKLTDAPVLCSTHSL